MINAVKNDIQTRFGGIDKKNVTLLMAHTNSEEAVEAFKGGAKVLIMPKNLVKCVGGFAKAVKNGEIDSTAVDSAVVEILKDANIAGGPVDSELATPTGSAIYMELCDEIKDFIPPIKAKKVGYGAGKKDFDHPNVLRIIESSAIIEKDTIDVI